jgi:hypothetical protein
MRAALLALCAFLSFAARAQPKARLPPPTFTQPGDPGWARTGGTVALVGAAGTLALALVAEGMRADGDNGTAVGGVALALAVPSALMASLGSASAKGADGVPALRIVGWIGFGLAVVDAAYLLTLGANGEYVPAGVITSTGVLATLSIGALAADAFIRANEAESAGSAALTARPPGDGPRLVVLSEQATRKASGAGLSMRF